MFSKLFDGVRHDSGDPLLFADQVIRHYHHLGIDPRSKFIIFSDALNYEKVARIVQHCQGKIGISFGIGTNLTNDVGPEPMNGDGDALGASRVEQQCPVTDLFC